MSIGDTMSRILVIDDDKYVRTSIRAVLQAAGHVVEDVGDAFTGQVKQRDNPFDVAIVDLIMPEKEGLETIRELKRDYPKLAIIAISGGGDIVRKNFAQAAEVFGASAMLEKPFGGDELLSTVSSVVAGNAA